MGLFYQWRDGRFEFRGHLKVSKQDTAQNLGYTITRVHFLTKSPTSSTKRINDTCINSALQMQGALYLLLYRHGLHAGSLDPSVLVQMLGGTFEKRSLIRGYVGTTGIDVT